MTKKSSCLLFLSGCSVLLRDGRDSTNFLDVPSIFRLLPGVCMIKCYSDCGPLCIFSVYLDSLVGWTPRSNNIVSKCEQFHNRQVLPNCFSEVSCQVIMPPSNMNVLYHFLVNLGCFPPSVSNLIGSKYFSFIG